MDDKCEEAVSEVEFSSIFFYISKFWDIFPDLSPLLLILENLWQACGKTMCLSILRFFHLTTLWIELTNINMTQLRNTNASKGPKR